MTTLTTPATDYGKCGCGQPAEKYSSGSPECWRCWHLRKMDWPAASYWTKAIDRLFNDPDGGSAPDLYDEQTWNKWGVADEVFKALYTLLAIKQAYQEILDNPKPWKVADES